MSEQDMTGMANRLRADHRTFEERFEDLCVRARGDWHDLDEVWGQFVRGIDEHFKFEEGQLFPTFAAQGPDCRSLVEELVAQHQEIRRMLEDLGLQIQLKEIRTSTIQSFTELLRRHANIENVQIYPWAERAGRPWAPTRLQSPHEGG